MIELAQARIERPELSGRLEAGLGRGSVLMIADAGFGKTTALGSADVSRSMSRLPDTQTISHRAIVCGGSRLRLLSQNRNCDILALTIEGSDLAR